MKIMAEPQAPNAAYDPYAQVLEVRAEERSAFLLRFFLPGFGAILLVGGIFDAVNWLSGDGTPERPIAYGISILLVGVAGYMLYRKATSWATGLFLGTFGGLLGVFILDTPDKGHALVLLGIFLLMMSIMIPQTQQLIITTALISVFIVLVPQIESSFNCSLLDIIKGEGAVWVLTGLLIAVFLADRPLQESLAELSVANERARQVEEIKDSFISSVNHEIRNPVTAMLGYLEILKLSANRATPERRNELIDEATQAGTELRELLQSILDARRLDQTAEEFEPEVVDVREAVDGALKLLDPRDGALADHPLQIVVVRGLTVYGDKVRLQQVLSNLISNAMKYSPAGAPIEVTAQFAGEEREIVARWGRRFYYEARVARISVKDYGLGVPPEQAPLLFQKFVRLPRDLASMVIGTGLGLYLCRTFVQAMGGQIWLESDGIPGEGTKFFIHLPLPPSPLAGPGLSGDLQVENAKQPQKVGAHP